MAKSFLAVVLLALLGGIMSACGSALSESDSTMNADKPAGSSYLIGVTDMTWGSCASRVRAALEKIDGVKSVSVSQKTNQATVTMIEGSTLDQNKVKSVLANASYGMSSFEPKS